MAKGPAGPLLLAIDFGSSSMRCVVIDHRGRTLAFSSAPTKVARPPDLAPLGKELDPQGTWRMVGRLVKHALREAGIGASRVAAIGVTSQREGCAFLDAHRTELYLAPNTDLRAFMEGQGIDEGRRQEVYRVTGHTPSFLFAPAKLLWLKTHRPELSGRVRHVLSLDAWLELKLTGCAAMERSAAAEIGLLDVRSGEWAVGLLARLGLPVDFLPVLARSGEVIGEVTRVAANETGLSEGTPVVAAGPDTQCGLLGLGVANQGQVGIVAGWSAPVQMALNRPCIDEALRTWSGPHVLPDTWVLESSATEAGAAYRWAASVMGAGTASPDHSMIEKLAARAPRGSNGALAFLGPRRANVGNEGPRWGGMLFPLLSDVMPVSRSDLFRAALENIAFAVKSNVAQLQEVSGVEPSSVSFGGGMAQNRTLVRMLAEVLGREVRGSGTVEVTALGAAMCAAVGAGLYDSLAHASDAMARPSPPFTPDRLGVLEYEEHYQRWAAMAERLEALRDTL